MQRSDLTSTPLPNYFFVGARGAGKTFAIRGLGRFRPRILIVDPTSTLPATFRDRDPARLAAMVRTQPIYDAVWLCAHATGREIADGAELIAAAMAERADRVDTLVIDELGVLDRRRMPDLQRLVRVGRHVGLSLWIASQRAVDAEPSWRALVDAIVVFRQVESRDLQALRQIHPDLAAGAKGLPDRHFFIYSTKTGRVDRRDPLPPMSCP